MPRGGKRKGAGAPKGNQNALKHGGRAKVLYGISLDRKLSKFEYRALCMEQLEALKTSDELEGGWTSVTYFKLRERYAGAVFFRESRAKYKCKYTQENKAFIRLLTV
jgi:hypothetical protein